MDDPIPAFGGQEDAPAPARPRKRPNAKRVVQHCHREIEALLKTQAATTAEYFRNEARIGARYLEAKAALGRDTNMEAWLAENLPVLSIRRAQDCASLAGLIDRFDAADDWYWRLSPDDRAAGWRTEHETGVRYGIEVIKLHRRYLNREPPPKRRAAKDRKAVQESKVSAAEKERNTAILEAMQARNALADEAVERHALAKRNRVLARDGQRQEARQRALAASLASLTRRCARLKRDNARLRMERERP